jgi:hypothetical protein
MNIKMTDKRKCEEESRLNDLAAKLLLVLEEHGSVWSVDTSICAGNGLRLMSSTDMCSVVRKLASMGIRVGRIDAGGNPTWVLEVEGLEKIGGKEAL